MSEDKEVADLVGPWSEVKLEIIRKYAQAYSAILAKPGYFHHVYIDAFAGLGYHKSKATQERIEGSPHLALHVDPPFKEYCFIDINKLKIKALEDLRDTHPEKVTVFDGDCNRILVDSILPAIKKEDYKRALCLLDPYGLHVNWEVIQLAGQLGTVEVFLNFPIMDMNMNVLKHDPAKVDASQADRMEKFWGDDSWRKVAYDTRGNLFGWEEKQSNEAVVNAYCQRLKREAGFGYVAEPLPMKNSTNSTVYYLVFASPNKTGAKIVSEVLDKYR